MKYSIPRGTKDILPPETALWQLLEDSCRAIFALYNYQEIRTPVFEFTDLFTRSIGLSTDIVKKEMYTFLDRKGRSLTLRPEATAAVVRAGLENNLISTDNLTKVYYIGPMFRYERPQAGRQRQFHQAGVEVFGSADPQLDAEVIQMSVRLFERLGINDLTAEINSVGCPVCQPKFRAAIQLHFQNNIKDMCSDCQERLALNPLRILDCKEPHCQKYLEKAPSSIDHLCPECKIHFADVEKWLKTLGVKYKLNDRLVRGLDYYTKTAFEIVAKQLGAQNAVCGGGRYDKLVEELGGKPTPAIGFAVGLERVVEILKHLPAAGSELLSLDLFVATIGDEAKQIGYKLVAEARAVGLSAELDYMGKGLKGQMKSADRLGAKFVYIIGEAELEKNSAVLKNMKTADQKELAFGQVISHLKP